MGDSDQKQAHLDFKNGNPGAVQYGNFINYYKFHPPESRLRLLPENIWNKDEAFLGLDLGCNAGDLTLSLYAFLKCQLNSSCKMLGIDIDPMLIQRANEANTAETDVAFTCLDFMNSNSRQTVLNGYLETNGSKKFSAIFCFSVTMWIHLNYGDNGLRTFLKEVCNFANLMVIEPQPWKCYRSAVKRLRLGGAKFPLYKDLKLRGNIEEEIEQIVLQSPNIVKVHETTKTEWGRKLLIFRNGSDTTL